MRLQQFLSRAGVASRRHAEKYIIDGHVRVNNQIISTLGTAVDPKSDVVEVKRGGAWSRVTLVEQFVYYALNKPLSYTTTVSDPHAGHTVLELVPSEPRVVPAGRLDKDSTGLLLLTNDGNFIHRITHPSGGLRKTYVVECTFPPRYNKAVLQANLHRIASGIVLDGKATAPAEIRIINSDWRTVDFLHLSINLHEGRNRQIRLSLQKIGLPVVKLKRTAIGGLELEDLELTEGKYLELSLAQKELVFNHV